MVVTSPSKGAWPVSWITRNARRSKRWADSGTATSASPALIGSWRLARPLARGGILSGVPRRGGASRNCSLPQPCHPWASFTRPRIWARGRGKDVLHDPSCIRNQNDGVLAFRHADARRLTQMDECVVCQRKVQRTENYMRCHLWAVSRRSICSGLRPTCAARASPKSKVLCGRQAAW